MRAQIHALIDQLPETQLAELLRFTELLLASSKNPDVEPEELWLLATGMLKRMVDEIEDAPAPVKDWRDHLKMMYL